MHISNLINFANPSAPKGLIRSAAEWVRQRETTHAQLRQPRPAAWVKPVFPGEENFNLLEYPFEPAPKEQFSGVRWTLTPPASLYYLQGCRVLGEEGAVISPDNRLFAEFTMPPEDRWLEHSCFKRRRVPPAIPLKGWYATIAWPESKFFFHWMLEALPRMAVLGEFSRILDGLFVPSPLHEYHKESLRILGIDETRLIPLDSHSHFQPEHLFVPRSFAVFNPPRWLHRWYKRAYLDAGASASPPARRRIFVSRTDAPARRIENENEVVQALAGLGFVAVRLSDHSFGEQARIFSQAEIIVAPHGAGLSHAVFCREETILVEIFPPSWMAPCFMTLASIVGCTYRHLIAQEVAGSDARGPQFNNIRVPILPLMEILAAFPNRAGAAEEGHGQPSLVP